MPQSKTNHAKSTTIWQDQIKEKTLLPGEPALLINNYHDMIEIAQGENGILINKETIPLLIKILKRYEERT